MNDRTGFISICAAAVVALVPAIAATQDAHQKHPAAPSGQHAMPALGDADFVHMVTKHHRDGIEMTRLEESKGTRAAVKSLAAKIRQGQERDLNELEGRYAPKAGGPKPMTSRDHQAHDAMMEKESKATMARLQSAAGAAVDQAFIEEMIKHHETALHIVASAKLTNAGLRTFAQQMAATQKGEIAELKKLQAR